MAVLVTDEFDVLGPGRHATLVVEADGASRRPRFHEGERGDLTIREPEGRVGEAGVVRRGNLLKDGPVGRRVEP